MGCFVEHLLCAFFSVCCTLLWYGGCGQGERSLELQIPDEGSSTHAHVFRGLYDDVLQLQMCRSSLHEFVKSCRSLLFVYPSEILVSILDTDLKRFELCLFCSSKQIWNLGTLSLFASHYDLKSESDQKYCQFSIRYGGNCDAMFWDLVAMIV